MAKKTKPNQMIKSLDRAIDVLEKIVKSDNGMGVTELSRNLGIHKSTIYRLLDTLHYRGYVEKNEENQKYISGIKLFELSSLVLNEIDNRIRVRPYLEELMEKTKETIHLGILDDDEIVYVDKVESPETIRMYSKVGKRVPTYSTSLGKVIMAFLDEEEVEEILENTTMEPQTANTITDKDKLIAHLKQVRDDGYAVDDEEQDKNIRCIAGPIFNYRGEIVAAFSISAPKSRMTYERIEKLSDLVIYYSNLMSKSLGFSR